MHDYREIFWSRVPKGVEVKFHGDFKGMAIFLPKRRIECPKPIDPRSLQIGLHEIGHQILHGKVVGRSRPRYVEEWQAELYSLEVMREEGIDVTKDIMQTSKRYVVGALHKAIVRGLSRDMLVTEIVLWCDLKMTNVLNLMDQTREDRNYNAERKIT